MLSVATAPVAAAAVDDADTGAVENCEESVLSLVDASAIVFLVRLLVSLMASLLAAVRMAASLSVVVGAR